MPNDGISAKGTEVPKEGEPSIVKERMVEWKSKERPSYIPPKESYDKKTKGREASTTSRIKESVKTAGKQLKEKIVSGLTEKISSIGAPDTEEEKLSKKARLEEEKELAKEQREINRLKLKSDLEIRNAKVRESLRIERDRLKQQARERAANPFGGTENIGSFNFGGSPEPQVSTEQPKNKSGKFIKRNVQSKVSRPPDTSLDSKGLSFEGMDELMGGLEFNQPKKQVIVGKTKQKVPIYKDQFGMEDIKITNKNPLGNNKPKIRIKTKKQEKYDFGMKNINNVKNPLGDTKKSKKLKRSNKKEETFLGLGDYI